LSNELVPALRERARETGHTLDEIVDEAMREWLERTR
jgi:hypothetical protein